MKTKKPNSEPQVAFWSLLCPLESDNLQAALGKWHDRLISWVLNDNKKKREFWIILHKCLVTMPGKKTTLSAMPWTSRHLCKDAVTSCTNYWDLTFIWKGRCNSSCLFDIVHEEDSKFAFNFEMCCIYFKIGIRWENCFQLLQKYLSCI